MKRQKRKYNRNSFLSESGKFKDLFKTKMKVPPFYDSEEMDIGKNGERGMKKSIKKTNFSIPLPVAVENRLRQKYSHSRDYVPQLFGWN